MKSGGGGGDDGGNSSSSSNCCLELVGESVENCYGWGIGTVWEPRGMVTQQAEKTEVCFIVICSLSNSESIILICSYIL
jgi:hypothetical protein